MAYLVTVIARRMTIGGVEYSAGDLLPEGAFTDYRIRQLRGLGWVKDMPVDGPAPAGFEGRLKIVPIDDDELAAREEARLMRELEAEAEIARNEARARGETVAEDSGAPESAEEDREENIAPELPAQLG